VYSWIANAINFFMYANYVDHKFPK